MSNNIYDKYLFSGISGIVEVSLTHPIDVFKTKLQEQKMINKSFNTFNIFKNFIKNNNIQGYYKGYSSRIVGIVPMRLLFWSTQSISNNYLHKSTNLSKKNISIFSGIIAGSVQTIIDAPIEVIKIRLISGNNFKNAFTNYKIPGFIPTLYRNVIFACFVNYGVVNSNNNKYSNFIYPATCAVAGSIISHPFDVVKTEMQRHDSNKKMIQLFKEIYKKDYKIFFTGCMPRSILSFFTMGIGSSFYYYFVNK